MSTTNKIGRLALYLAVSIAGVLTARASTIKDNGIVYSIDGSTMTAKVTGGDEVETLIVPSAVNHDGKSYTVTAISNGAFYNMAELKEVQLPATIKLLGTSAFQATSLKKINLPEGLETIEDGVFYQTCLEGITIPSTVTRIGGNVFGSTNYLDCIKMLPATPPAITDNPFHKAPIYVAEGSYEAYLTAWPKVSNIVPENTVSANIHVTSVSTLAEKLKDYDTARITHLTISGPLNGDDIVAIHGLTNLMYLDLSMADIHEGGSAISGKYYMSGITCCTHDNSIGAGFFHTLNILHDLILPNSVTTIGELSYECKTLRTVRLGNNVREIGQQAFTRNYALRSINLPSSITKIGPNAFEGCESL